MALIARVRSLTRLKMMTDELRMRAITSREIGIQEPEREAVAEAGKDGRILMVDDRPSSYERIAQVLSTEHSVDVETNPHEALFHAAEGDYDLLIVSLGLENFDGLRLCSQVALAGAHAHLPILAIADADNNARLLRGLEIGVNDYLMRPIDKNELLARVRTQIRSKRYTDRLRDNVQHSIEMAITDGLTGLHNRRYMESHLATLVEQAAARGKPLALLMLDIDFFKSINDSYGHDAGDDVLREFAHADQEVDPRHRSGLPLWRRGIRHRDAGDRLPMSRAMVAERLRRAHRRRAVRDRAGRQADRRHDLDRPVDARERGRTGADVLKRADTALYRAKRDGRNRVVADAA